MTATRLWAVGYACLVVQGVGADATIMPVRQESGAAVAVGKAALSAEAPQNARHSVASIEKTSAA